MTKLTGAVADFLSSAWQQLDFRFRFRSIKTRIISGLWKHCPVVYQDYAPTGKTNLLCRFAGRGFLSIRMEWHRNHIKNGQRLRKQNDDCVFEPYNLW